MDAIVARRDESEQQIGDIEDKLMETNETGKKRENKAKEHKEELENSETH